MSSTWNGKTLTLSIFGESHGAAIGAVLDGLPAGEVLDAEEIRFEMARRAPGKDRISTARREADLPEILSGTANGCTTGTPLCAVIRNTDTHSGDYADFARIPRPGHADYTGSVRYGGHADVRGGGHFSGRLTAPMVFAGAVCRQILRRRGVEIAARLASIGGVRDAEWDPARIAPETLRTLAHKPFPTLDDNAAEAMQQRILNTGRDGDSVGGLVECAAVGLPAGLGDPIFGGVENRLSALLFGIPAVRGIEFGAGFAAADMSGSAHNDAFAFEDGRVVTKTNRHGGVLGGITSGMPLMFRLAFKPTPSIAKPQESVDLSAHTPARLVIHGRHDPCVAVRAVPVVEALTAVCLLDFLSGTS